MDVDKMDIESGGTTHQMGQTEQLQQENDDLRTVTNQNESIVMELSMNGRIQLLSKCWEDIVGTSIKKILKKPISRIIVGDLEERSMFDKATKVMEVEDMSYRVRFSVKTGKLAIPDNEDSSSLAGSFARKLSESGLSSSLPSSSPFMGNTPAKRGLFDGDSNAKGERDNDEEVAAAGNEDDNDYNDDDDDVFTDRDSVGSTLSLSGDDSDEILELEGQGLLIRNRDGKPTHTMWVLKPFIAPMTLQVDLPEELVQSLGFGADVLVTYLESLSNSMVTDLDSVPAPPTELCRICERHVPTWWFERHSNVCILEHKCESELEIAHESLMEQRSTIASLLTSMDNYAFNSSATEPPASPPRSFSSSSGGSQSTANTSPSPQTPTIEYRGFALPIPPASETIGSPPRSPASTGAALANTSRQQQSPGQHQPQHLQHQQQQQPSSPLASSFVKRTLSQKPATSGKKSPIRLMELLLELCDMALQINVPESKNMSYNKGSEDDGEIHVHSPQSETRMHQVQGWAPSQVDDPGLSALCTDTESYARLKVDAALRLGNTIVYSERIRMEIEAAVQRVIEDAVEKIIQQQEEYFDETIGDEEDAIEVDEDDDEEDEIEHSAQQQKSHHNHHKRDTSMFSDSYLQSDILPTDNIDVASGSYSTTDKSKLALATSPSTSTAGAAGTVPTSTNTTFPSLKRLNTNLPGESSSSSSFSETKGPKSVTPKSLLSGVSRIKATSSLLDSDSGGNEDHGAQLDLDLNATIPKLRQRKSTSGMSSSGGGGSSGAIVPRNMTGSPLGSTRSGGSGGGNLANSPVTPFSSPLLIPHDHVLQQHDRHHRRQSSAASDFSRTPVSPLLSSTVPSTKPPQPSIKDYEIISPISKGAFGSVYLSRKKLTGEYFAIKVLKKSDMVAKNQVMNVKAERVILMAQSDSPFVAKLFYTFQSKDYLFLVMEYLNGGDCAALIKVLGGLSESWTQRYMAEVVVGVEDLHKKGIVHRDLKPDNLLIDAQGHLKLTDFGLSRMGLIGRHTKVSTSTSTPSSSSDTPLTTPGPSSTTAATNSSSVPRNASTTSSLKVPSDTTRSSTGGGNFLHDPSISLAPGYFNLNRSSSTSGPTSSSATGSIQPQSQFQSQASTSSALSTTPNEEEGLSPSSSTGGAGSAVGAVPTPPMVLFDPNDNTHKFVGTPDYLAPETINGVGQDERSDWWSLGCILFEFLFGYPPFHDSTPEAVFNKILNRHIQLPSQTQMEEEVSPEAIDLIEKLLCTDTDQRLGANGADEIKSHPFFNGITNWDTLWDEKASFVPDVENPESTDYFDSRGAVMQEFPDDMALELDNSTTGGGGGNTSEYDHQSDSSETPSGSPGMKKTRKYMPLHIPPHVRDGTRARRLSEPVQHDDFGSFSFKNLPVLEKANKELIYKLRSENMEHRNSVSEGRARTLSVSGGGSGTSGAHGKRTVSPSASSSLQSGQSSPRHYSISPVMSSMTPNRHRLPSTSTVASEEDAAMARPIPMSRKRSFGLPHHQQQSSSHQHHHNQTPQQSFSDFGSPDSGGGATAQSQLHPNTKSSSYRRLSNMGSSPELRDEFRREVSGSLRGPVQVFDMSPYNSDSEEHKNNAILRTHATQRLASINSDKDLPPHFRPLDILVCDVNPVWRYSTEKMLVRLGNRVVSVSNGTEAIQRATGDIRFDIILIEYKLSKSSGADVARLVHNTINPNTATPIVAMTNLVNDAEAEGGKDKKVFDGVIAKPVSPEKIVTQLSKLCRWRKREDSNCGEDGDGDTEMDF